MKKKLQITFSIILIGLLSLYILFNQTLPVTYGEVVLKAEYDGLISDETLMLYDNEKFSYTDGWTKWNGTYQTKNDTIILDYYFSFKKIPTIYIIEDNWINSYKTKQGKNSLVHNLRITKDKLYFNPVLNK